MQETLSAVADDGIEQSGLHIWSFGQLPESYEQKRGNKVKAWPALVDESATAWRSSCLITPQEQQQMMAQAAPPVAAQHPSPIGSICTRSCRTKQAGAVL